MSKHGCCALVVLLICASQLPACDQGETSKAASSPAIAALIKSSENASREETPTAPVEEPAVAEAPIAEVPAANTPAPKPTEEPPAEPAVAIESVHVGYPAWDSTPYGNFLYYVPSQEPPKGILVLVHAAYSGDEDGSKTAKSSMDAFAVTAQNRNLVIVAPCFDNANYGLHTRDTLGGYRSLLGRFVGADRFLEACVDRMVATFPQLSGKFYLFGHGAGGQFVSCYIVKHPERIVAAVMSRTVLYAFPSPDVPWPDGMARQRKMMRFNDDEAYTMLDYTPNPQGWVKAAQLPVTVVVGALDVEPVRPRKSQPGMNVIERSRNYVRAINEYARKQGVDGRMKLVVVDNVRYGNLDLVPACIVALLEQEPS